MSPKERALQIIRDAENELASLIAEAGRSRKYDEASELIELAREFQQIAMRYGAIAGDIASPAGQASHSTRTAPKPKSSKTPVVTTTYPKFYRDGDALIKIGWSKSAKQEYEHKSPRKVLRALIAAMNRLGTNGRRFSMERVLPLNDMADATPLPDYQAYICLAWLRSAGIVAQHGRQGYSIAKRVSLDEAVERVWSELPSRP
jgi:hypothetical protein